MTSTVIQASAEIDLEDAPVARKEHEAPCDHREGPLRSLYGVQQCHQPSRLWLSRSRALRVAGEGICV